MTAIDNTNIEDTVRSTLTNLKYLLPGPAINRRFVTAGRELSTGNYGSFPMTVRDGQTIRDHLKLSTHGFQLLDAPTTIPDFHNKNDVEARYKDEVCAYVKDTLGADLVVATSWMIRSSGDLPTAPAKTDTNQPYKHYGGVQPPAGEVHVDTEPSRQAAAAQRAYEKLRPDGPGFKRYVVSSFWRVLSALPQNCPLAVCDARTVRDDEGVPNVLWVVDEIPEGEALFAPREGEDEQIAAAIFEHSPDHRWWYFSGMTRDQALMFKFHDSERVEGGGWRVPHTAFWDESFPGANVRESIECRTIAFWE